jgi:hypothetical protein
MPGQCSSLNSTDTQDGERYKKESILSTGVFKENNCKKLIMVIKQKERIKT